MTNTYDAIVVGGRCGGSATAMLLARAGRRVLVLERASFPSDTVPPAGNVVPHGAWFLREWGLLDALIESGCPPVPALMVTLPDQSIVNPCTPFDGISAYYVASHRVLDTMLADAAVAAGAEMWQGVRVTDLLWDGGRVTGVVAIDADDQTVELHAPLVIGADGTQSIVARLAGAETYRARPAGQCAYYAFWTGLDQTNIEVIAGPRPVILFPTHNGETWIIGVRSIEEWPAYKADAEANYMAQLEAAGLGERLAAGARVSRLYGTAGLNGYFRTASGPGWALVGDAGHCKDPGPGRGISDAFIQADMLARALTSNDDPDEALALFARERDARAVDIYDVTQDLADAVSNPEAQPPLYARLAETEAAEGERILATNRGETLAVAGGRR